MNISIVFFVLAPFVLFAATLPAVRLSEKYKYQKKWNHFYPFSGMILWFFLAFLGVGSEISLYNYVYENFFILIVSIITPWIVFFLYRVRNHSATLIAKGLTFLPIVFTVIFRLVEEYIPD